MSISGHSIVSRSERIVVHCPARVWRAQILRAYWVALPMYYKRLLVPLRSSNVYSRFGALIRVPVL